MTRAVVHSHIKIYGLCPIRRNEERSRKVLRRKKDNLSLGSRRQCLIIKNSETTSGQNFTFDSVSREYPTRLNASNIYPGVT
jgi:hypothetical protein